MSESPEHLLLIGYSARVPISGARLTEAQRRNLFKPEVDAALSVDEMIWKDIFDVHPNIERPEWVGYVQDLWASLSSLRRSLDLAGLVEGANYELIAVALSAPEATLGQWAARVGAFEPNQVPANRPVLGYDVADDFLMSALCNGAFLREEVPDALRAVWGPKLNSHHLFAGVEGARSFIPVADARFPEHAPFQAFVMFHLSGLPELSDGQV